MPNHPFPLRLPIELHRAVAALRPDEHTPLSSVWRRVVATGLAVLRQDVSAALPEHERAVVNIRDAWPCYDCLACQEVPGEVAWHCRAYRRIGTTKGEPPITPPNWCPLRRGPIVLRLAEEG